MCRKKRVNVNLLPFILGWLTFHLCSPSSPVAVWLPSPHTRQYAIILSAIRHMVKTVFEALDCALISGGKVHVTPMHPQAATPSPDLLSDVGSFSSGLKRMSTVSVRIDISGGHAFASAKGVSKTIKRMLASREQPRRV